MEKLKEKMLCQKKKAMNIKTFVICSQKLDSLTLRIGSSTPHGGILEGGPQAPELTQPGQEGMGPKPCIFIRFWLPEHLPNNPSSYATA